MSLLTPDKWRFCKLSPMSSPESDSTDSSSPPESPQPSPSTTPVPRINKQHGFLRHIIQNQIERDEYEKALTKTRAERDQEYQRKKIEEKVSQDRYIPPHLRRRFTFDRVEPQLSPQTSNQESQQCNNNDSENDPYHQYRIRARRSLQREGF